MYYTFIIEKIIKIVAAIVVLIIVIMSLPAVRALIGYITAILEAFTITSR